jgi:hypothetical protein
MKKYSIQIDVRGGLGNQLFQIVGSAYLAKKLETNLLINETALKRHKEKSRRNWSKKLDLNSALMNLNYRWISEPKLFNTKRSTQSFLSIEESLILELKSIPQNYRFRGWFQEYRFAKALDLGKKDFNPLSLHKSDVNRVMKIEENQDLAGIHMRFGDFLSSSWGVLSTSWYEKCLTNLIDTGIEQFDVYSDDIPLARHTLNKVAPKVIFNFPEETSGLKPHKLLWQMRHYKTFISSNSSLSWWASFLNVHDKPVIYSPWEEHLHVSSWKKII